MPASHIYKWEDALAAFCFLFSDIDQTYALDEDTDWIILQDGTQIYANYLQRIAYKIEA